MRISNVVLLGSLVGVAIGAAAGVAMAGSAVAPLETVSHVDLPRYLGRWHEIAKYPNRFERKCDHNVTAEYATKGNSGISVVNACITQSGKVESSAGTAKVVDSATNAKLKVTFFWPFYGNYWIVDLGQNYEYAAVSEPSRKYLWILSRTPSLPDDTYRGILSRLSAKGLDPAKLVKTTQLPR